MNTNNFVACLDDASPQHDGHDPGLSDQSAFGCAVKYRRQKAWLECVNLSARVSESGDLNQCFAAQAKLRT